MMVEKFLFGKFEDGSEVCGYRLDNGNGLRAVFIEYGAVIQSIEVLNSKGEYLDVVLGYDDLKGYEEDSFFLGSIVGRNANRIRKSEIQIDGITYKLGQNENENNLHSGPDFYKNRIWNGEIGTDKVTFFLHSPDGDQGYPGNMDIQVSYEITKSNTIRMTIEAESDKNTICNMVNHVYFNLNGQGSGEILGHKMKMPADRYLPNDSEQIPTGEIAMVQDTPFDFRQEKPIGRDYDNTFCIPGEGLRHFAQATGDKSGISLEISSDLPGVQLYTGTFLGKPVPKAGKGGYVYGPFGGFAMETQFYPNAINEPNFQAPILLSGQKYKAVTEFRFK